MAIKNPKPLHPGVVLQEYYLKELGWSQSELARQIDCQVRKVNEIVNGRRGISCEFAIDLERVLGTSAEMWVRMQAEYDLALARQHAA
jgi:antitoxin HigA-1